MGNLRLQYFGYVAKCEDFNRQKVGNFGVGENWVKKVFNGNVAVYIGQKAVKGDFFRTILGQNRF